MKNSILMIATYMITFLPTLVLAQQEEDKRNVWTGGQKGFVVVGDLSILKNLKSFNVMVAPQIKKMGVKNEPDTTFISKRVTEWNEKKTGKGDQWLTDWNKAKKNFKSSFIEGFNVKTGMNINPNDSLAEYTFIIYTQTLMDYMKYVYVILDMDVVKTNNVDIKIATIKFPFNNNDSPKKSKTYKSKYEGAYFAAGFYFGKYCNNNIYNNE